MSHKMHFSQYLSDNTCVRVKSYKIIENNFFIESRKQPKVQYIDPCMSVTISQRLLRHYWHWHCVRFPCQAQGHTLFHWVVNACWEWPVSVEFNNPWFAAIRRQSEIFLSKIIISSYTGVTVAHSYASSNESSLRYYAPVQVSAATLSFSMQSQTKLWEVSIYSRIAPCVKDSVSYHRYWLNASQTEREIVDHNESHQN